MLNQRRPGAPSQELMLVEVVTLAQRRLSRDLAVAFLEEGSSLDQWRILRALADGEGHSMGELAESLQVPHPTLTRLVDGLGDSGDAYRRSAEDDRRRVVVHLSRRGRERLDRLDALVTAHQSALRASAEGKELFELLRRATESL
jgi:DNA-binding MarR family transcriptional regulator